MVTTHTKRVIGRELAVVYALLIIETYTWKPYIEPVHLMSHVLIRSVVGHAVEQVWFSGPLRASSANLNCNVTVQGIIIVYSSLR